MSTEEDLSQEEIQAIPSKLIMLLRFSQFIGEGRASIDKKYKNVIKLNSFLSNTFSIGREDENMVPFIGVQDKMIPWFFEANWEHAYLCLKEGFLYLTTGKSLKEGIILGIKIRKKRMSVLWPHEVIGERELRMKIFKMISKSEYQISKKIYLTLGISMVDSIDDFMKGNEIIDDDDDDDDFMDVGKWN